MNQYFTDFELIRFVYGETTPEVTRLIKEKVTEDPELNERLSAIRAMHQALSTIHYQPSPSSVNIILAHGKNARKLEASY